MRIAVYYAPAADDPLHVAGSSWLGRDAALGPCGQPALPAIGEITAEASRYGFHATLKPPMRLREGVGQADVLEAATALARSLVRFELPRLEPADLHGYLALRETAPCPELQALADACVAWFDDLRAAPGAPELARRQAGGLSAAREANLRRWGYPDVFATWRFHMTLTRRLAQDERSFWQSAAAAHFAAALGQQRMLQELCLFVEPAPGQPFVLTHRITIS